MYLELSHLKKSFGEKPVVEDLTLSLPRGELLCILGSSGCGKTTTLNMIGGFLAPDSGQILLDGEDITAIPPERRPVSTVFQSYGLFPHMTVLQNVVYGLKFQHIRRSEAREKGLRYLEMVGLADYAGAYIHEISGGQQQRVALARALVTRPSILLLDEPLSNLDAKLRVEMQVEIKRIQKELGITTIIVTHDHEEAVSLADRVIVMNAGHILQIGKPQEVFDRPASPFIADFMGFSTFLHGIAAGAEGDMRLIRCGAHTLQVPAEAAQELSEGDACILAIRSENIRTAEQEGVNTVRGTVKSATYKGHTTRLEVSGCFEEMVYPAIHEYADVQEGSEVLLHFPAQHFCVYKDIK